MTSSIAQEVHARLLEARPQHDDLNLKRVTEIILPDDGEIFVAIQQLRSAISEGTPANETETLLLQAIRAAEHWVAREQSRTGKAER